MFDTSWLMFFLVGVIAVSGFLVSGSDEFFSDKYPGDDSETVLVTKVIDGDTIIVEGGRRVRLLGIDSEERGEPCYQPAKEFLKGKVLDRRVRLVSSGRDEDEYGRMLRHVFLNGSNVNVRMVEHGFAVARTDGDGKFSDEIVDAEKKAIKERRGCEWSELKDVGKEGSEVCLLVDRIGEKVSFEARVEDYYRSDGTVFLNFGGEYPEHCFTVVVWSTESFDGLNGSLEGENVTVSGEVGMYDGVPQISVDSKGQLER